jgi:glycosyltransferase involved in cell wall biosynthesis
MTAKTRKRIGIICFSNMSLDTRVQRQARTLARDFDVTLLGFGKNPFADDNPPIAFRPLEYRRWQNFGLYPLEQAAFLPGLIFPGLLHWPSFANSWWREARRIIRAEKFDAVVCNDTETMTLGIEARKVRPDTKLILDLHEYATREAEPAHVPLRKRIKAGIYQLPLRRRLLRHVATQFDGIITVNEIFSDLYVKEFGLKKPIVVWNAPRLYGDLPEPRTPEGTVQLIHHGSLSAYREPERMIKAVGMCGPNYRIHFMFGNDSPEMTAFLKSAAEQFAPGQVEIHPSVRYDQVISTIARYDAGVYILPPKSFNDMHAMPNKFFEFIGAGLAVVIAPSVCMAAIVKEHGLGIVAEDFSAEAMAAALRKLTPEVLAECRKASREARQLINSDVEQEKLAALVRGIFSAAE